jgi:thiamine-phosphate pyrophosphorylase
MVQSEISCQLYLIIPAEMDHDAAIQFAESGSLGNIACAILQSGSDGKVDLGYAEMLRRFSLSANISLLLENDISAAADVGADGVHIPADEDIYTEARKILGDDAIIGVDCGMSRHAALTLAEMGADYVAFKGKTITEPCQINPGLQGVISWWSEMVTVPCVAWDTSSTEAAMLLAECGADFVAMGSPIWSHPKGPTTAAAELHARLTETLAAL